MLSRLLIAATLAVTAVSLPAAAQSLPVSYKVAYAVSAPSAATNASIALNPQDSSAQTACETNPLATGEAVATAACLDTALAQSLAAAASSPNDAADLRQISQLADRALAKLAAAH